MSEHRFVSRTYTLAAGQVQEFSCMALDYLYVSDTTAPVDVSFNERDFLTLSTRRGLHAKPGEQLGYVKLRNSTGAPLTCTVETGDGTPLDARDSSSAGGAILVTVNGPNPLPVSLPAGAVAVNNFPATQPISATQLPAALNADGSLNVHDVNPSLDPLVPLQGQAQAIADLVSHQVIAARAAGKKIAVRGFAIANESAVATRVTILDGATEIFRVWMAANSNFSWSCTDPLIGTAATALNAINSVNASLVTVTAVGHEI